MVTSTWGCLTPKGHFGIDCLSPSWLRSWQTLALGECSGGGMMGGREHEPPRAAVLWFGASWKYFPDHNPAVFTPIQLQSLSLSCHHHWLFALNYCISSSAQNPKSSAFCPHICKSSCAITETCNLLHAVGKTTLFFSNHQALLRTECTVSLNLHQEKCVCE